MKKVKTTILTIALLMAAYVSHAKEPKVMCVDLNNVYQNYTLGQEQEQAIQDRAQKAQEEMNVMVQEGRTMFEDYQKLQEKIQSDAFDDKMKDKFKEEAEVKREALALKEQKVNNFNRTTQQDISAELQEVRTSNLELIKKEVELLAKERNIDIVTNSAGVNVLFCKPEYMLDDVIIERLNKKAKQPAKKS